MQMKTKHFVNCLLMIICLAFTAFSCRRSINWDVECDDVSELIFQTQFNNCEIYEEYDNLDRISGIDTAFSYANNWDELDNHNNIGNFKISYEDGDRSQRYSEITDDPLNPGNKVLMFKIVEPHINEGFHKKGRVQANLNDNQCIKEFYQTVRLYLHPDMEYLKQWQEKFYWLSLFEFWNNANFDRERNPFRVTVNLVKTEEGEVENIYFHAKGDRDIRLGGWDPVWQETATAFSVPFGIWMNIELYIKEGDENNGKFFMAVTPDNGVRHVVFDITNTTQHPREKYPDGYTHINALKFYTGDDLITFMKNNNKKLEIYWDDWSFYRNTHP